MSNWRIEAGKAAWNAIKPLAKTGAKTVSEWKNKASLAKLKTAGDAAAQRIKAAAKKIDKVTETLKKQTNILDK